jgi:hypothetical protein
MRVKNQSPSFKKNGLCRKALFKKKVYKWLIAAVSKKTKS